MLSRYTRPEMAELWNDQKKYETWLEVEIAADEAWSKLGHIPAEDIQKLKANASLILKGLKKSKQLLTMM